MKKRFFMPDTYWETGLLEQWLEEQAAQGWLPVSFAGYSSGKFEKAEPQILRFRLEPNQPESFEAREERENAYRDMGWRFAANLGEYRVYYCGDQDAAELHTDPAAQSWAWETLLRKLRRNSCIYMALLAVWTVLQFRSIWEKGIPVETFLYGMWGIWLFVLWYFARSLVRNLRALRGIRAVGRRLKAGIPLEHGGDLKSSLRRRKWGEAASWAASALLVVFTVSIAGGASSMDLEEAPAERPWVAMAALDPETADLEMDWAQYREDRHLLVPFCCQMEQWRWEFGPWMRADFDRTVLPVFAKALYEERLNTRIKARPNDVVEILEDPRFDGAAVVTGRDSDGGRNIQMFVAYKNKAVVCQAIRMDADLRDHLDDFAAILAEFQ